MLSQKVVKEYSINFLIIYMLMDFEFVILLKVKICEIIGISKIEVFFQISFFRVKQNQKKLKTIPNLLSLCFNHFSSNFNKSQTFF